MAQYQPWKTILLPRIAGGHPGTGSTIPSLRLSRRVRELAPASIRPNIWRLRFFSRNTCSHHKEIAWRQRTLLRGRFPFLDHRVVEFCNQLPPHLKLNGLNEQYLLKKLASKWLPDNIANRTKRPYRAPIHRSFFNDDTADYVTELLSPEQIQESGFFKPAAVNQMARKVQNGMRLSETDDMALAGVISTQLIYSQFIKDFRTQRPVTDSDNIKICYGPQSLYRRLAAWNLVRKYWISIPNRSPTSW